MGRTVLTLANYCSMHCFSMARMTSCRPSSFPTSVAIDSTVTGISFSTKHTESGVSAILSVKDRSAGHLDKVSAMSFVWQGCAGLQIGTIAVLTSNVVYGVVVDPLS